MDDEAKFHKYFRLLWYSLSILLVEAYNGLQKQHTRWTKAVSPKERECCKNTGITGITNTEY
jgi:hypothetical protein